MQYGSEKTKIRKKAKPEAAWNILDSTTPFFQDIPFGAHLVASPSLEKIWGLDCAGPKNCTSCEQGFALVQVDLGKRAYGTRHAFSPWKKPGSPTFYWILVVEWQNPYIGLLSPHNRVVYPKRVFFFLARLLGNFSHVPRGEKILDRMAFFSQKPSLPAYAWNAHKNIYSCSHQLKIWTIFL